MFQDTKLGLLKQKDMTTDAKDKVFCEQSFKRKQNTCTSKLTTDGASDGCDDIVVTEEPVGLAVGASKMGIPRSNSWQKHFELASGYDPTTSQF